MATVRRLVSIAATSLSFLFPFIVLFAWRRSAPPSFLLYWPTLVSAGFLFSFGRTLWFPPPFVERFARLQNPNLTVAEQAYCRHVTQAWCLFFIANGSVALALALKAPLKVWAVYSGAVSYVLIGLFFGAEYLIRRRRFPRP